jgi:taurine--2-oxoglutarate transaminase
MGHPLACAAAVASINIFKEEKVLEHVRKMAENVVGPELDRIKDKHPSVGDVRGLGMFWAIELVRDRETRKPYVPFNAAGADAKPMAELAAACKERGLWPFTHFNRMHVVPPCTTSEADLHTGLAIIDDVLSIADKHYEG